MISEPRPIATKLTKLPHSTDGRDRCRGGWNVNALVAAARGALPSSILPNFTTTLLPSRQGIYGWFFGVAIGAITYSILSTPTRRPVNAAATA